MCGKDLDLRVQLFVWLRKLRLAEPHLAPSTIPQGTSFLAACVLIASHLPDGETGFRRARESTRLFM